MKTYQKPATIVVKLKNETLLEFSRNTDYGGGSRELRRAWKDED